jgi:BlaR1 peptidase M56
MDTLQNFIPHLGYGFVCSFWQMALLFGLYKLTAAVYLSAPAERFRFAFLLSVFGTGWFLYTVFGVRPSAMWQDAGPLSQNIPWSVADLFNQSLYWLGCIYLCILAFAALKGYFQWQATRQMMASGNGKAPVEWRLFTEKYGALLGIKQKIALKISGSFSPATFGLLKPVILLPASCLTGLSTAQVQAILLHELAHIRRADYLAAWVMQIAEIMLFFNPFMRQLIQEAKKECEHACDDLVMQFEYNPVQYAQALLEVAKTGRNMAWALQAQGSRQYLLLNRITRLLGQPNQKTTFSWKAIGFSALAITLFLVTNRVKNDRESLPSVANLPAFISSTSAPVTSKSWKQSLLEARIAILAEAAKKSAVAEKARQVSEMRIAQAEALLAKNAEPVDNLPVLFTPASILLSANWADEQQAEAGLQEMEMAWKQFTVLLEKLELTGDLEEKEWEQIAALISLHADIREAIYKETALYQNLLVSGEGITKETNEKILVIVHEEATGKLAATFMHPDDLNATFEEEGLPENSQRVVLLRKKGPSGKKIIRL